MTMLQVERFFPIPRPGSNTIQCGTGLGFVNSASVGNQAGDGFAVARDGDLFTVPDAIQKHSELVFRLKSSDFP
jgi:hypothetical protein